MKKILLVSDSPYATTGLGRMSKYFLKMLPEYDWTVWGFLHPDFNIRKSISYPFYDPKEFGGNFKLISPKSYTDNQFGLEFIPDVIAEIKPDYIITSFDYDKALLIAKHIKELQFTMDFKWINYFPMDREDFKEIELDVFRYPDINVCITKFGVNKIHEFNPRLDIKQIYHPIDAADFPDIDEEEIKEFKVKFYKDITASTFLMGTVNRSFARKDTGRLVAILSRYLAQNKNGYSYIHGSRMTAEGLDLAQVAYFNGLPEKTMSFLPKSISEVDGIDNELLNKIYRSFDLFVTVSTGEGFGFTTVEALLTGTPIIAPSNTSFPELVQDFGVLIKPSEMAYLQLRGNPAMFPIVNCDDVIEKIGEVRNNLPTYKEKALRGKKWVKENLSLDIIADQWRKVLK